MIRWRIFEPVIASMCFLCSYTATRPLLHCSLSYTENKRREKQNSDVLSPFHATLSL